MQLLLPGTYFQGVKGYRSVTRSRFTSLPRLLHLDPRVDAAQQKTLLSQIRQDVQQVSGVLVRAGLLLHLALQVDEKQPVDVDLVRAAAAAACGDVTGIQAVNAAWVDMKEGGWGPVLLSDRQRRLLPFLAKQLVTNFNVMVDRALEVVPSDICRRLTAVAGQPVSKRVASLTFDGAPAQYTEVVKLLELAATSSASVDKQRALVAAATLAAQYCATKRAKRPKIPLLFPQAAHGPRHVHYSGKDYWALKHSVLGCVLPSQKEQAGMRTFTFAPVDHKWTCSAFSTDGASASLHITRLEHVQTPTGNLDILHKPRKTRRSYAASRAFHLSALSAGGFTTVTQLGERIRGRRRACEGEEEGEEDELQPHKISVVAVDPGRRKLIHAVGFGKLSNITNFTADGRTHGDLPQKHFTVDGGVRTCATRKLRRREQKWLDSTGADAAWRGLSTCPSLRCSGYESVLAAVCARARWIQDAHLQRYYFGDQARFARSKRRHFLEEQRHDTHVARQLEHTARHKAPRTFALPHNLDPALHTQRLISRASTRAKTAAAQAAIRRRMRRRRAAARQAAPGFVRRQHRLRSCRRHRRVYTTDGTTVVVIWGDYAFGQRKGLVSASHGRYVVRGATRARTVHAMCHEWGTSKHCFRCTTACEFNQRLAWCKTCDGRGLDRVDRDAQGAFNIGKVGVLQLMHGIRPLPFIPRRRRGKQAKAYWEQREKLCAHVAAEAGAAAAAAGLGVEEAVRAVATAVAPFAETSGKGMDVARFVVNAVDAARDLEDFAGVVREALDERRADPEGMEALLEVEEGEARAGAARRPRTRSNLALEGVEGDRSSDRQSRSVRFHRRLDGPRRRARLLAPLTRPPRAPPAHRPYAGPFGSRVPGQPLRLPRLKQAGNRLARAEIDFPLSQLQHRWRAIFSTPRHRHGDVHGRLLG